MLARCYMSKNHATRTELACIISLCFHAYLFGQSNSLGVSSSQRKKKWVACGHPFKSWLLSLSKFQTLGDVCLRVPCRMALPLRGVLPITQLTKYLIISFFFFLSLVDISWWLGPHLATFIRPIIKFLLGNGIAE